MDKTSQVLRDVLMSNLALRLPGVTFAASVDGNGDQLLTIGTLAAGNQCGLIRIKPMLPVANVTDILGLPQRTVTPHQVQIALETSAVANVTVMTQPELFLVLAECFLMGCQTELYMEANTVAPATTTMVASKLKAIFSNQFQFGAQSAI